jgi:ABC-type Fe3+-hydroxamate transport system substrate-binding protein
VQRLRDDERDGGLEDIATYRRFQDRAEHIKRGVMRFFLEAAEAGKTVVCYGAAAKGNTLLNYCGITRDLVAFAVDRSPHKQGYLMPGSHIPVRAPEAIAEARPDYIFILPWNLRDEIVQQLDEARGWGARFVVPIPDVTVVE